MMRSRTIRADMTGTVCDALGPPLIYLIDVPGFFDRQRPAQLLKAGEAYDHEDAF